jgi:hypothetical protein
VRQELALRREVVSYDQRYGDTATLHAIHRKDGRHELLRSDLRFVAVGAGVSTCAPVLEQAAP